jgi:hypothetical protein
MPIAAESAAGLSLVSWRLRGRLEVSSIGLRENCTKAAHPLPKIGSVAISTKYA